MAVTLFLYNTDKNITRMKKNIILKNALIFRHCGFQQGDLEISAENGKILRIANHLSSPGATVIDLIGLYIIPGLVDMHVHLREPGFEYKETIKTGSEAAARAGYTDIFSMPNLNPVPDSLENLKIQTDIIAHDAIINVHPYASITMGQKGEGNLVDFDTLAPYVLGFSDDGRGVQSSELMRRAMIECKRLGKTIVAHCEDNSLLNGGYIHDGKYAAEHHHRGISSASEWRQVERDLHLVAETGCRYHVCHISTRETVDLIRVAKAKGLPVTCETAPHYLLLNDSNLKEDAAFKMNPPLRSADDQAALIEGLIDGTIDVIATDHAPHAREEKSKGLGDSAFGIVGLETAFPLMFTNFVRKDIITMERLIELMSTNPRTIMGLQQVHRGEPANLAIFNLDADYFINPENFKSKGRSTPFAGYKVQSDCVMTILNGKIVYRNLI